MSAGQRHESSSATGFRADGATGAGVAATGVAGGTEPSAAVAGWCPALFSDGNVAQVSYRPSRA
ncbi:MAG: hypothetical protein QOD53_1359, partial [Thermoleophilaceae bacterium]|nr:hypothetical protein [Thermoleophilaceae bacterium]